VCKGCGSKQNQHYFWSEGPHWCGNSQTCPLKWWRIRIKNGPANGQSFILYDEHQTTQVSQDFLKAGAQRIDCEMFVGDKLIIKQSMTRKIAGWKMEVSSVTK
jgi:hypothetical protein